MRNNLYASVSGTIDGEAVAQEFKGLEGVILFTVQDAPRGKMSHTLLQGRLPPKVVAVLLRALRDAMGPAAFAAAMARSMTGKGLHREYDEGAGS